MFSADERQASFAIGSSSTSSSAAKKRQSTKAAAASSSSLQWPHPVTGRSAKASTIPTPEILAKYGFYHSPTPENPDAVSHFLYPEVQIANWQSNDNPLARLEEILPGNGWCRIFRSQEAAKLDEGDAKWTWSTPELLPTSKEMIQARKESFGSQWPYDGKKGWKPTSKKLAEAGFYFTPTDEEPDNAKCIYCNKSLGGWEKSDDPVHEHQRRVPDCAFFNCELREVSEQPAVVEDEIAADVEEEIVPVVAAKKGGSKRAVSAATRKASASVAKSKGKKSTAATAKEPEEDAEETTTDVATGGDSATQVEADEEAQSQGASETPAPAKRGGRKTRSVSTKKLAAKTQAEEEKETAAVAVSAEEQQQQQEQVAPPAEEEQEEEEQEQEQEAALPVQEPVKTLSKKKSATGLGNGIATQASSSTRPTRAASRRATKAINLLSDEGLNRKLRRPDEEDLERRELALSDPVAYPTASSDDQPNKPKKSRSRSKKLDQDATPVSAAASLTHASAEPEPEPESQVPMEEDAGPTMEDNTIIEHADDDVEDREEAAAAQDETVEEEQPKRRGGRSGAKSSGASVAALSKASSTSGTKSKRASTRAKADMAVAFPSMSSEADATPAPAPASASASDRSRSSRSVSNALGTVSSKASASTKSASSASASSCKQRSNKSSSVVSGETGTSPDTGDEAAEAMPDSNSSSMLPNTASQATIRGAAASRSSSSSVALLRSPLSQLPQLTRLDLDASQRGMALGDWLQAKAEAAAREMREQGEAQLADLENQLRVNRVEMERRLRGLTG